MERKAEDSDETTGKGSLNAALRYRRQGLSVIPIEPRGKTPLVEWKEFQKRRATETEIRAWFRKWPNANVGIVTGKISDLVVVDIDADRVDDPDETLQAILKDAPTDMIARTGGGGYHAFYRYPRR